MITTLPDWKLLLDAAAVLGAVTGPAALAWTVHADLTRRRKEDRERLKVSVAVESSTELLDISVSYDAGELNQALEAVITNAKGSGFRFADFWTVTTQDDYGAFELDMEKWLEIPTTTHVLALSPHRQNPLFTGSVVADWPMHDAGWVRVSIRARANRARTIASRIFPISAAM